MGREIIDPYLISAQLLPLEIKNPCSEQKMLSRQGILHSLNTRATFNREQRLDGTVSTAIALCSSFMNYGSACFDVMKEIPF